MTIPRARSGKFDRNSAFCSPASTNTASTTPMIEPLPPKIETPPSSTIATTLELEAEPVVLDGGREAERVEDPDGRADHAREDEQPHLDPLDADPGEGRRLLVRADRVERAPERREVEDEPEDHREDEEDHAPTTRAEVAGNGSTPIFVY